MTLAEFLLARIAEDEAKVQYMQQEKHRAETAPIFAHNPPGWLTGVDIFVSPDRWATECEAKRRIVGLHSRVPDRDGDLLGDTCAICNSSGPDAQGYPCETLRLLALSYVDHPDYRQEWKP